MRVFLNSTNPNPPMSLPPQVQCTGVDSSWTQDQFVTSGQDSLDLWNYYKAEPLRTFEHGNDTFSSVRFNPIDPHLFLATSMDRLVD